MAIYQFEYHTFLHHSQTYLCGDGGGRSLSTIHFYIILKQVAVWDSGRPWFEYHTFLHHSQTSNLKMNCFHLHKTGTQTSDGY